MFILLSALAGAIIGGLTARRRKGNRLDIAQYAAGYAMAFTVVSMVVAVILDRTLI
ncbi:MAG: apolipoprotein acyltransferase [Pseudomonadota bacterium]